MTTTENYNFPDGLSITPNSTFRQSEDPNFGVQAQKKAIEKHGIAGRVWEAANALNLYVNSTSLEFDPPFPAHTDEDLTMIELGSGTGIVGANIAKALRPHDLVIVTDVLEVCPLLTDNLRHNSQTIVRPLAWGSSEDIAQIVSELFTPGETSHTLTHIICSDLVYFPELFAPLIRTLLHLTSPPFIKDSPSRTPEIIISYKVRSLPKEAAFWAAFGLWFTFFPVLARPRRQPAADWARFGASFLSTDEKPEDVMFIFSAKRRKESMNWLVPVLDTDLIGGVGAWGSNVQKCDDTFETVLLMNLGEQ